MRGLALALFVLAALPALAVEPGEMLADPALEARARAISQDLRCLVCQNQSIDDSGADLAHDLRVLVRERLAAGDSDAEVLAYVVARYGDYVLLDPPFQASTWALWLGPFGLLGVAGFGVAHYVRRQARRPDPAPAPLSAAETERLRRVLNGPESA
ncbi:MAG: cytochrome c-type biogenesis protein CcmH [Alphaproteobacteria bacterium]|nr:cytochrome c-type biogenesis protein CcmH [Alphaproteobacteria bacterium]